MRLHRVLWIARVLVYRARYGDRFSIDGFGHAVGRGVKLVVREEGSLHIGSGVQLGDGCEVSALGGDIRIARNVFFNKRCTVVARGAIEIGQDCLFGPNVGIFDHDHGFADPGRPIWAQEPTVEPVVIGSNVWVGANVVLARGARLADRVVVGANSVVTRSLDAPGVYAGNPAVLVRPI